MYNPHICVYHFTLHAVAIFCYFISTIHVCYFFLDSEFYRPCLPHFCICGLHFSIGHIADTIQIVSMIGYLLRWFQISAKIMINSYNH